jgi:hypothetical protein
MCAAVLKNEKMWAVVGYPAQLLKSAVRNRDNNLKKAERLIAGREKLEPEYIPKARKRNAKTKTPGTEDRKNGLKDQGVNTGSPYPLKTAILPRRALLKVTTSGTRAKWKERDIDLRGI